MTPSESQPFLKLAPVSGSSKPHLSFTRIETFLRCPRKYRFRYVEKVRTPPSGATVLGRTWHKVLEQNYRQKIRSGQDLSLEAMEELFLDHFYQALLHEEIAYHPWESPEKIKEQGLAVVAEHHRRISPHVHPQFVEERFVLSLGDDFPFDLAGVWDLIEQDGTIVDHKAYSERSVPTQEDLDKGLQFTAYALAYRAIHGKVEPRLRLDVVIKSKKPQAVQFHTKRTNDQCRWFLRLLEQVAQAIHAGSFYPNPADRFCGPLFCPYWERCMKTHDQEESP
jgi:RecB family exonuclease